MDIAFRYTGYTQDEVKALLNELAKTGVYMKYGNTLQRICEPLYSAEFVSDTIVLMCESNVVEECVNAFGAVVHNTVTDRKFMHH